MPNDNPDTAAVELWEAHLRPNRLGSRRGSNRNQPVQIILCRRTDDIALQIDRERNLSFNLQVLILGAQVGLASEGRVPEPNMPRALWVIVLTMNSSA